MFNQRDRKNYIDEQYCNDKYRVTEVCNKPLYYPGSEGYQKKIKANLARYQKIKNLTTEQYAANLLLATEEEIQRNFKEYKELHEEYLLELKVEEIAESDFIDEQIDQVVKLIERPCLMQVLYLMKKGYTTTACNGFNIGLKGTWFKDNHHDYFFSLTGEVWKNLPLPTYQNKNTDFSNARKLTDEDILSMNIQPNMIFAIPNDSYMPGQLTHQDVKDALQYLNDLIPYQEAIQPLPDNNRSWFRCNIF